MLLANISLARTVMDETVWTLVMFMVVETACCGLAVQLHSRGRSYSDEKWKVMLL